VVLDVMMTSMKGEWVYWSGTARGGWGPLLCLHGKRFAKLQCFNKLMFVPMFVVRETTGLHWCSCSCNIVCLQAH
jgi:hypothetical protein